MKFGDLITMDHVDCKKLKAQGMRSGNNPARDALVIYDRGTDYVMCYDLSDKTAQEAAQAIRHFRGRDAVASAYSDQSKELIKALTLTGILHIKSIPGIPQTNGMAESMVGIVLNGARVLLMAAGLPSCFWPFAARHFFLPKH